MILAGVVGVTGLAGEVLQYLTVDGKTYEAVKFGAVVQGKIPMFHSRGMIFVPVEKLPEDVREKLGIKLPDAPKPEPIPVAVEPPAPVVPRRRSPRPQREPAPDVPTYIEDPELAAFHRAEASMVVFAGHLVDRSTLTELTGFLTKVKFSNAAGNVNGQFIDLARKTEDAPQQLELRPSLWKRTGECVLLKDYKPDDLAQVSGLVRTYGREIEKFNGLRAFQVGAPVTFAQWKRLQNGSN